MQYQKEEIRAAILKAARKEFAKDGYYKASIRQIAKKADVLPSNIYNYFGNKDQIFREVLSPILNKIEKAKSFLQEYEFDKKPGEKGNLEEHLNMMLVSTSFVDTNRELLKLLIFKAHGSSLENYEEELIEWYADNWYSFIKKNDMIPLDKFVIRNIMGVFYNLLKEILLNDIKGEELKNKAMEMMTFIFRGWKGLVEWKKSNE
jgi:AcrR family transcriptional regulator